MNKQQKTAIGGVVGALALAVVGYLGVNGLGTPNQFTTPNGNLLTTENLVGNLTGQNQTVYITKSGEKYHLEGCRHLRFSRKIPINIATAREEGYEPCKTCKPDQSINYIPLPSETNPSPSSNEQKQPAGTGGSSAQRQRGAEPIVDDPD